MEKIIVTSPEELEALIESSVKRVLKANGNVSPSTSPEHFTVKQAAAFLDLAEQTIYGLTSRNEIPHYKRGKKLYFLKTELEKWILENRKPQIPSSPLKRRPDR